MSDTPATVVIASPVGPIRLIANEAMLTSLTIIPGAPLDGAALDHPILSKAAAQLSEYFAGKRQTFDLPLLPPKSARGASLRNGIADIAYGDTVNYGALAAILESGPRAVGQACRRNRFPIIIPCHRVTSVQGSTEHYSGGDGIVTKAWLNQFEQNARDS